LGVLDVGSNTVHLQVVDAHPGARPSPATSQKIELRLHEYLNEEGDITSEGVELLETAIADAISHAHEFKTEEILAFATSAIRDAKNGKEILDQINQKFEIDLQVLSGDDEARMTFLAVRRWLGWSSGRLLVLDIGGGSLEIAVGDDESAEATVSLPLGASRLTREYLGSDPHTSKEIKVLENYILEQVNESIPRDIMDHVADHFVATSKTFRTLARLGEHWFGDNAKYLKINSLNKMIPKLQAMSNSERAELPGVSQSRARQIVAGAIVARTAMEKLQINELEICPWALREGIVLRWLDWMER
jgi:exopolyphosphatase/guanosine-5'-triphosphate,3'-diphosphate pyrophosphatase